MKLTLQRHLYDYTVSQLNKLERKLIEPVAFQVEARAIRGLQRFISDVRWDKEQMLWNYRIQWFWWYKDKEKT